MISQVPPLTELGWKNVPTSFLLLGPQLTIFENYIGKIASFRYEKYNYLKLFLIQKDNNKVADVFYEVLNIFQVQQVLAFFNLVLWKVFLISYYKKYHKVASSRPVYYSILKAVRTDQCKIIQNR